MDCNKDITYELQWTLQLNSSTADPTGNYEAYGYLTVDIGNRPVNQKIKLWEVRRENCLIVPLKQAKFFNSIVVFQEREEFKTNGILTLYGNVVDSDASKISHDDVIGEYNNKQYTISQLQDGVRFNNDGYVEIHMKISVLK